MQVKYFGRDPETGAIRLSRKVLEVSQSSAVRMLNKSARRKDSQSGPPSKPDKEQLYYDLDLLLNALMDSIAEEAEVRARLEEAEEELSKAKSKYVFLCETSYTNRLLAEGFMQTAHDKYVRALARKKAVEETLRNAKDRSMRAERAFKQAREMYLGNKL